MMAEVLLRSDEARGVNRNEKNLRVDYFVSVWRVSKQAFKWKQCLSGCKHDRLKDEDQTVVLSKAKCV